MRFLAIGLVLLSIFCSGCIYKGNLKENFYASNNTSDKLPLRAYLIFNSALEESAYHAENIFYSHGVDIATKPGLKAAMNAAFGSTFETLYTATRIDSKLINEYDVIIIPRIELIDKVITVSATLKEAANDSVINTYRSSGNIYNTVPTSAHTLAILNIIPGSGLTTPIIAPIITNIIGEQAQTDLENILRYSLGTITDDMRNDRSIVARFKKVAPK